jgi:quinol monooxygenase YgiN
VIIVHVHVHVLPEHVENFKAATLENARHSVQEPGIARFDVLQQRDDPTRFVLVEAFRTADAPEQHRATAHYLAWRDAVGGMMAEPRQGIPHVNLFPDDSGSDLPASPASGARHGV